MNTEKRKAKLGWFSIYSYGLGEFGWTFLLSMVSYYLLYYMTDVLMLPLRLAGIIYAAVQWVEAGSALAAGVIMDHARLRRGQYSPWLLIGGVTCAAGSVLYFTNFHLGVAGNAVAFVIFYTIAYAGFNFMWISHRAMAGLMGGKPEELVRLTISGTQMGTVASLAYGFLYERIRLGIPDANQSFPITALVFGGILVFSMSVVYRNVRPYDTGHVERRQKETAIASLREMLMSLIPVIPYGLSYILSIGASTLILSLLVYYFTYAVGRPELLSVLMTVMAVVRFAATFLVAPLAKRFDKKSIYIGSVLAGSFFCCCAYFFRESLPCFFVLLLLYFFSLVPAGAMFMPCITDAADYNEYIKNLHTRGFLYSVASTFSYVAQFVGASVSSVGLVAIGYQASWQEWSARMIQGIAVLTLLGTAVLTIFSAVPMIWYPLNRKTMEQVYIRKDAAMSGTGENIGGVQEK